MCRQFYGKNIPLFSSECEQRVEILEVYFRRERRVIITTSLPYYKHFNVSYHAARLYR